MTQAKIMKVVVSNIPKELKVIELNPKKSYYFQEFDQKLQMIKELSEETNQSYKLNIALVDYDDMTIDHYHLENYELDKYLNPSIKQIIESDALKQTDTEEKGITEQHMKAFINLLEESDVYDVASNEEVKTGKLKKAGLLSKLRFRSRRGKVEAEEVISEDEISKNDDFVADEIAGNTEADSVYDTEEIAQVIDLPDSHESTNTEITTVNKTENTVNNIEETHLDDSVKNSENQINDDNAESSIEKQVIDTMTVTASKTSEDLRSGDNQGKPVTENEKLQHINLLQEGEKLLDNQFDIKKVTDLKADKRSYKPENIMEEDPLRKKETTFLQDREKEKARMYNTALEILSKELTEYAVSLHDEVEKEINEYLEANKPDYQSRINELIDQENVVNKEYLQTLSDNIDKEINLELEKDDKEYELARNLKKSKLNTDKEERLAQKRSEINKGVEVLKERTKNELDSQLKILSEEYKNKLLDEKKSQLLTAKINRMREIDWSIVQFDRETFDELRALKRAFEMEEIQREQIRLKEEEIKNSNKQLALQEEEQALERRRITLELEKAEAVKYEAQKTADELASEKEKTKNKELELLKLEKELEMRKVTAKEQENKINAEQNRLKQLEIDSRNKETDNLNKLAQNKMYSTLFGVNEPDADHDENASDKESHSEETTEDVPKKSSSGKSKAFLTGLITAILLTAGSITGVMGYEEYMNKDDVKADEQKKEQQIKDQNYQRYVDNGDYIKAYEVNQSKAEELKASALKTEDYVDAVKLGETTDDNEYLMKVYLKNGNIDDMTKRFKDMSYEEQASLSKETQKEIAGEFLKNKQYKDAERMNRHLKDKKIEKKIKDIESEQALKNEVSTTESSVEVPININQGDVNNEQTK